MAVPTLISDLSTTASSNSPAGSDSPVDTDNFLRAHAAFIAQLNANKADKASPTFTGVPAAPTAAADTNTTQVATTAFVIGQAYAKLASPTFTGTVVLPSTTSIGNASSTEIGYLAGVTSAIQTQLNAKAPTASPTFTGTVVLPSTTSIGTVSSTEIGYLDNVTSAIQTQLDAKAPLASPTFTGTVTAAAVTTTGNTILGNASTDTLNVGNGGLVKDGSGNVGIGTASPLADLDVSRSTEAVTVAARAGSGYSASVQIAGDGAGLGTGSFDLVQAATTKVASITNIANAALAFGTNGLERMQITSDGYLRINGSTDSGMISSTGSGHGAFLATSAADNTFTALRLRRSGGTYTGSVAQFERDTTTVGSISVSGSATAYNTSSDYRLKNISGDLQNSGAFIDALQPRVGTWKVDGSPFVGFVAHELQAVSPSSVFGEKDGEQMQAVAYGSAELIANMVAELKSLRARVAALEA